MENLKIQVNNEAESKEAQELFFELGGVWASCGKTYNDMIQIGDYIFFTDCNMLNYGLGLGREEITTQQLRDLVVLKRNDVDDATHVNLVTGSKVLQQGDKNYYWQLGEWHLYQCGVDIKPIEKEMKTKEYLEKQEDGSYELVLAYRKEGNDWIEVPDGAVKVVEQYIVGRPVVFINEIGEYWSIMNKKWCAIEGVHNREVLWQRSETEKQADDCENKPFSQCIPVPESAWDKQEGDEINNPIHYTSGSIECIDAIEASMSHEAFCGFLKGNVQKYLWRYQYKGRLSSLNKAKWYIDKLIEKEKCKQGIDLEI